MANRASNLGLERGLLGGRCNIGAEAKAVEFGLILTNLGANSTKFGKQLARKRTKLTDFDKLLAKIDYLAQDRPNVGLLQSKHPWSAERMNEALESSGDVVGIADVW